MSITIVKSFVRIFIDEGPIDKIADILNQKIMAMPFLMRTALGILTNVYYGMKFLPGGQRLCSYLPPFQELMKFYQKMSIFIYYSKIDTKQPLG